MSENTRLTFWECCAISDQDRKNMARSRTAMIVWGVTLIGSLILIKKGLIPEGPMQWIVGALPLVTGLWVLSAYSSLVRGMDELQRKILVDALAFAFGGTFFLVVGYSVLLNVGAPVISASDLPLVMALLYFVGTFIGWRRYR